MTYAAREVSRALGSPLEIYLFRYGPEQTDFFAYTDNERAVQTVVDGVNNDEPITFAPVPINRDEITTKGSLDRQSLEIRMDYDLELVALFSDYPPSDVVTISVFGGHRGDTELKGLWFGRVLGFRAEGTEAIFNCEPVNSSLKRPGLRRHYQYGCPHVLYGPQCKASRSAATSDFTVVAVSRAVINLGASWADDATRITYHGGIAEWTTADGHTVRRTIINSANDGSITLGGRATGLTAGLTVSLSLGCNHQMDHCRTLHGNILNFGGQPWIPLKNPVGLTNNFY